MNERMLELYRRAQVPGIAIDPTNNMHYETTHFSAEKFAELIVRECARVSATKAGTFDKDSFVAQRIREHFGVEE